MPLSKVSKARSANKASSKSSSKASSKASSTASSKATSKASKDISTRSDASSAGDTSKDISASSDTGSASTTSNASAMTTISESSESDSGSAASTVRPRRSSISSASLNFSLGKRTPASNLDARRREREPKVGIETIDYTIWQVTRAIELACVADGKAFSQEFSTREDNSILWPLASLAVTIKKLEGDVGIWASKAKYLIQDRNPHLKRICNSKELTETEKAKEIVEQIKSLGRLDEKYVESFKRIADDFSAIQKLIKKLIDFLLAITYPDPESNSEPEPESAPESESESEPAKDGKPGKDAAAKETALKRQAAKFEVGLMFDNMYPFQKVVIGSLELEVFTEALELARKVYKAATEANHTTKDLSRVAEKSNILWEGWVGVHNQWKESQKMDDEQEEKKDEPVKSKGFDLS